MKNILYQRVAVVEWDDLYKTTVLDLQQWSISSNPVIFDCDRWQDVQSVTGMARLTVWGLFLNWEFKICDIAITVLS